MPETYLATLEDLATLTSLPATSPKLALALSRASNRFRDAVGYPVHQVSDELIWLDGDGTTTLLLPAAPVQAFEVSVNGEVLPDSAYEISRRIGVVRKVGGIWPDGLGNIQVTYSHGWAQIPGGIQDAVLEQAQIQATILAGVQQQSAGPYGVTYGVQATVGVTQKWTDAVAKYSLGSGDRS
ncbi:mobile element protein [Arthrobacter sp. SDTb3-6]|uniref:mobile element protein n=1 Tax=Arthrobacter sp. SDTb3-6 TaxID=2713571 RepID=UPI00159E5EB4|nr:mobile element protein [Arthrobacter sp. SDTb3-6]NVM97824.1 mobile element protein [Arthrobacter sp. SDTb3-6]